MPPPPETDTAAYHTDWKSTEYTLLTAPVRWNSWELEKLLPVHENTNRADWLVASRDMLLSDSVTRDIELAAVVAMLDTRSNLQRQVINAQKPRNVKLKLKVNSLSIESENKSGVFSIYTLAPRRGRVNRYYNQCY